jgi:hypothetical protein
MGLEQLPRALFKRYHIEERRHACAVLAADCPGELSDIIDCLNAFRLLRSEIEAGGGGKTRIANLFDHFLAGVRVKGVVTGGRGWRENSTKVSRLIGEKIVESVTHKVDLCKGRVALEVEWNNKDPFFARDMNAFRMLHELNVFSVGVIITRMDELQELFDGLYDEEGSCGRKYGASTTHWGKLMPRVENGAAGSCPLLLIGIQPTCHEDDVGTPRASALDAAAGPPRGGEPGAAEPAGGVAAAPGHDRQGRGQVQAQEGGMG